MKKSLLAWLLTATAAVAHPGHDAGIPDGAVHWLVNLDHLAVIVAGVALVWLALDTRPLAALRRWLARD
jgi:hydrogenase/urease accessory protein HupE